MTLTTIPLAVRVAAADRKRNLHKEKLAKTSISSGKRLKCRTYSVKNKSATI